MIKQKQVLADSARRRDLKTLRNKFKGKNVRVNIAGIGEVIKRVSNVHIEHNKVVADITYTDEEYASLVGTTNN